MCVDNDIIKIYTTLNKNFSDNQRKCLLQMFYKEKKKLKTVKKIIHV